MTNDWIIEVDDWSSIMFGDTLQHFISIYGYLTVAVLVGLESIGLPVPGETTLLLAALYAGSSNQLNIWYVIIAAGGGAIVGDNIGYWIGRELGYRILRRWGHHFWLPERRLKVGQFLFRKHGGKIVVFGRFMPFLRFLAAFLAGVSRMPWRRFLVFNSAGAICWATGVGLAAFYLGKVVERYIGSIGIALGILTVIILAVEFIYLRRHARELQEEADREMSTVHS